MMNINSTTRRIGAALAGAAVVVTLSIAGTGAANAADLSPEAPATSMSQGVPATYGLTMRINNTTDQTMTVLSAENPYGNWQKRAVNIAPHSTIEVSDESWNANGAIITLKYQLDDGTTITMNGYDQPFSNSVDGQSSNPNLHSLHGSIDNGFHPTASFIVG